MSLASLSAVDGFVIAMLAVMTLSFGIVILMIVCGLRSAARRNADVDDLIDEIADRETRQNQPTLIASDEQPRQPWEKQSDWWKS